MKFVIPDGYTAYNVALAVYGDSSYALKVLSDNNLTWTSTLSGITINYDGSVNAPSAIPVNVLPSPNQNLTLTTNEGQTVYDMALMTVGLENLAALLSGNSKDFSFVGLTSGKINYIDPQSALNGYVRKTGLVYNTGGNLNYRVLGTEDFNYLMTEDGNYIGI